MTWLVVVVLAVLAVALYPVVRDFLKQRRQTVPDYVEGLRLMLDGRADEAIARFKETVNHDSDNIDAYIRLGDLFMQKGDVERALRIHENLALRHNLSPQDERKVYQTLVRDYARADRKVKAIAILEELVHLDKSDAVSRERLLDLYIDTGAWEKAEALLKDLGRDPAQRPVAARLYTAFGKARSKLQPDEARGWFEEAIKFDPAALEARVALGDLQLARGDIEAAIRTWGEVTSIAPEQNRLVRDRLERAYFEAGRFEDVTRLYEQLLRKVPSDSGLAVALADIYQKKEDLPAALRLLEKCCNSPDGDTLARLALAALYIDKGETARARQTLGEVITRLSSAA
jgi:lipopolysaccharide biosynthesis regulator YciM